MNKYLYCKIKFQESSEIIRINKISFHDKLFHNLILVNRILIFGRLEVGMTKTYEYSLYSINYFHHLYNNIQFSSQCGHMTPTQVEYS